MIWSLTHNYHFICVKCNVEMFFLNMIGTPHNHIILECPKCTHQIEVLIDDLRIPKKFHKDSIADHLRWCLEDNYHFICVKCNDEISFLNNVGTPHDRTILECPKGNHQIEVTEWKDLIKY